MLIRNKLTNNSYLVKVMIFQVTSETAALNTDATLLRQYSINIDYFMVGECVRFLFTSCEGSLNERVSAANE